MLDFLKEGNIKDDTIKYINDNFSNDDIMALCDNRDECLKIINILKRIGITNIDDLLTN